MIVDLDDGDTEHKSMFYREISKALRDYPILFNYWYLVSLETKNVISNIVFNYYYNLSINLNLDNLKEEDIDFNYRLNAFAQLVLERFPMVSEFEIDTDNKVPRFIFKLDDEFEAPRHFTESKILDNHFIIRAIVSILLNLKYKEKR